MTTNGKTKDPSEMTPEEHQEHIRRRSDIAGLFGPPDLSGERNLLGAAFTHMHSARSLLEAAIAIAHEGYEQGSDSQEHHQRRYLNLEQLLEAYRVAVILIGEAAEHEQTRRARPKAGKAA